MIILKDDVLTKSLKGKTWSDRLSITLTSIFSLPKINTLNMLFCTQMLQLYNSAV